MKGTPFWGGLENSTDRIDRRSDAQRGSVAPQPAWASPRETPFSQPETPACSGRSSPQGFCPPEHESIAIP